MRSLRWRFIIPFVALLVVALGGLSFYLSSYIRDTYLQYWKSSLLSEARLVATETEPILHQGGDGSALRQQVASSAATLGERITIIRPDGVVLADSATDPATMENHLSRPEVQAALKNQEDTQIRTSGTLDTPLLYAAVPIHNSTGQVIGIARTSISLASVNANLTVIQRAIYLVTLIVILLASILALLLTRYTVIPIQRLTLAAQQMSAGEFNEIPPISGHDEIAVLNQAFNSMAIQLKGKIAELETERGKLSAVLANMTDGIVIVDDNGVVQLINPAATRMFKAQDDSAPGRTLIEVSRQHQLVDLWRACRASGRQENLTLETTLEKAFVQAIATPLENLPGSTLLILQDLTRIRRLEMVRRDFVSNVSHELRTPLASLKALAETLREGALEDPPAARRFLLRMESEIDTLTQLVRELLELSRIESGRVPLEKHPLTPAELVSRAVERMQMQAERAGLSLRQEIPDNLPLVNADRERMEQVVVNLLHNAIKFTQPGGEVIVSAYLDGNRVVFFVRDTGVGISEEALPRIFERFYKADRARSGGGTGLGLSIARHLVESHGGRIWAESKQGEGSTFYFSVPVAV